MPLCIASLVLALASPRAEAGTQVAGHLAADTTWNGVGSPYLLDGEVIIEGGVTLTVAPGVVIEARSPQSRLIVRGRLDAAGTALEPVRIVAGDGYGHGDSGQDDEPTAGHGATGRVAIRFTPGSEGSLELVELLDVGGIQVTGASPHITRSTIRGRSSHVSLRSSAASIIDCTIETAGARALTLRDSARATISGNRIHGGGVSVDVVSAAARLRGNQIHSARGGGIEVEEGVLVRPAVWSSDSPYVLKGDLGIAIGATLTLSPGVVVKAKSIFSEVVVLGRLHAVGREDAPIALTSYRDDEVGGDTNGDGDATVPAPGDWVGVGLSGSGTAEIEGSTEIRYAGYFGEMGSNALGPGPRQLDMRVRAACSRCHAFPTPEILPRDVWRAEVERMAGLVTAMPDDPALRRIGFSRIEVLSWYAARAPERLELTAPLASRESGPLRFRRRGILMGKGSGPGVATVSRIDSDASGSQILAVPNMMTGSVHLFTLTGGPRHIGEAGHPARISSGDLDGDGDADLIISDLGEPMPTDKPVGRVIVGLAAADGSYAFEVILEDVGRVADARAIDADDDGDLDIAVAAFGLLRRGGIHILYNESKPGGPLSFRPQKVLSRTGAVSLVPLPRSKTHGGTGFAVAFAQHHEMVSAFHITASGLEEEVLYRAPHPNWGISNLVAVDLDGDSDIDFVLSHGDTLDDGIPFKPYHGVQWLENDGGQFHSHPIGTLYGAHAAAAADLDGDGDLDVAATSFLPQVQLTGPAGATDVDSVVWFERTRDGWIPHSVERGHPRHTGMTIADLNLDGRPDLVTATNFAWDVETRETGPSLEAWLNQGPAGMTERSPP